MDTRKDHNFGLRLPAGSAGFPVCGVRRTPAARRKSGMSVLEYSLLIAALLAALLGAQVALRRAMSHKWREAADAFGSGRQYEPDGAKATRVF